MDTLYDNLLSLCREKGITGGKMCTDIGLSKSLMTGLKKGRRSSISTETAQKIAEYFGVSVDRVLGSDQKEKSPAPEGVELDKATLELLEIWKSGDDSEREFLLANARMLKARRKNNE